MRLSVSNCTREVSNYKPYLDRHDGCSVEERVRVCGRQRPNIVRYAGIVARLLPKLSRGRAGVIPHVQRIGGSVRRRKGARRHLAIGRRRVQHRHLIEGRRKPQDRTVSKEDDVVRMPIRIGDERAERIEPLKATGIFTGQTSRLSQENSRTSPGVRGIVLNRRQAQYRNTTPGSDPIKSLALQEIVGIGFDGAGPSGRHAARRHHIQRERFEHDEIAPAPGDGITSTATSGELDQHVTSVDERSELRTLTARR